MNSNVKKKPLAGRKALVTSGPTYEPLDPVRFIGNRSSGKQGHAIAAALAQEGADVTLITGPVALPDPMGVKTIHVETAQEMLTACEEALPVDIAVCAAAVADYRPKSAQPHKIKKRADKSAPAITLTENPDILHTLATHKKRPALVVGFAAETQDLLANATDKLKRKACDFILANDVGADQKVFGAQENHVYLISAAGHEDWGKTSKTAIAEKLARTIEEYLQQDKKHHAAE